MLARKQNITIGGRTIILKKNLKQEEPIKKLNCRQVSLADAQFPKEIKFSRSSTNFFTKKSNEESTNFFKNTKNEEEIMSPNLKTLKFKKTPTELKSPQFKNEFIEEMLNTRKYNTGYRSPKNIIRRPQMINRNQNSVEKKKIFEIEDEAEELTFLELCRTFDKQVF